MLYTVYIKCLFFIGNLHKSDSRIFNFLFFSHNMISPDFSELEKLSSKDGTKGLSSFSEEINSQKWRSYNQIDLNHYFELLYKCLDEKSTIDITNFLFKEPLLTNINEIIQNRASELDFTTILKILNRIKSYHSGLIVEKFQFKTLVPHFTKIKDDNCKRIMIDLAATMIKNTTEFPRETYDFAIRISEFVKNNINTCITSEDLINLYIILDGMIVNELVARNLIQLDFLPCIKLKDDDEKSHTLAVKQQLDYLVDLLPRYGFSKKFYERSVSSKQKHVLSNISGFLDVMQPVIIEYFQSKNKSNEYNIFKYGTKPILYLLAYSYKYKPMEWNPRYTLVIKKIIEKEDSIFAPFILLLLLNVKQLHDIIINAPFDQKIPFDEYLSSANTSLKWYSTTIGFLKNSKVPEFSSFYNLLNNFPQDFKFTMISPMIDLLKDKTYTGVKEGDMTRCLRYLLHNFVKLQKLEVRMIDGWSEKDVTANLTILDWDQNTENIPPWQNFAILFSGKYGLEHLKYAFTKYKLDEFTDMPSFDIGISYWKLFNYLHCAKELYDYRLSIVDTNNEAHEFSVYDNFYSSVLSLLSNPYEINTFECNVIIEEGEIERTQPTVRSNIFNNYLSYRIVELIRAFYKATDFQIIDEKLDQKCYKSFNNLMITCGFHSPESCVVFNYPFLFSMRTRIALLRTAFMDFETAYNFVIKEYNRNVPQLRTGNRVTLFIERSKIYEDGIKIMDYFGKGTLPFDIQFKNEPGIGQGPTREFMQLLAQEIVKDLEMWKQTSQGYFPVYFTTKNFFEFGILAGRSVLSNSPINIPLSKYFFSLCKGESVHLKDVDPEMYNTIRNAVGGEEPSKRDLRKSQLIGLNFELINGEDIDVTPDNVADFYYKAMDVAGSTESAIKEFLRGFNTVLPRDCMKMFTTDELLRIICGDNTAFTIEEFEAQVTIGSDATPEMRRMLAEVVCGFDQKMRAKFIEFVTGSPCLPIGGLGSLDPKIQIQLKRGDSVSLPSVTTCTNYLKIPNYPSIELMREKFITALEYCGNHFGLS